MGLLLPVPGVESVALSPSFPRKDPLRICAKTSAGVRGALPAREHPAEFRTRTQCELTAPQPPHPRTTRGSTGADEGEEVFIGGPYETVLACRGPGGPGCCIEGPPAVRGLSGDRPMCAHPRRTVRDVADRVQNSKPTQHVPVDVDRPRPGLGPRGRVQPEYGAFPEPRGRGTRESGVEPPERPLVGGPGHPGERAMEEDVGEAFGPSTRRWRTCGSRHGGAGGRPAQP